MFSKKRNRPCICPYCFNKQKCRDKYKQIMSKPNLILVFKKPSFRLIKKVFYYSSVRFSHHGIVDFLEKLPDSLIRYAIIHDPYMIMYIPCPSESLQDLAFDNEQNVTAFINNPTPGFQHKVVMKNYKLFLKLRNPNFCTRDLYEKLKIVHEVEQL